MTTVLYVAEQGLQVAWLAKRLGRCHTVYNKRSATRQLVLNLGMVPMVPTKANRIEPWDYN